MEATTSTDERDERRTARWSPLRLRRITSDGSWIPELDGLRFVAIAFVVLYHIYGQLIVKTGHPVAVQSRYWLIGTMAGHGDRGVRLFFVISGFVLARGFARQHMQRGKSVSLSKYFLRRVTRLEPPYIVNLLACAIGAELYYHTGLGLLLHHLLVSLTYTHNLAYGYASTINNVAWSLEVEIQFYILAPLISLLFLVRGAALRRSVFVVLIAVSGFLQTHFHAQDTVVDLTILYYIQYFLAGLLLTDLYLTEGPQTKNHAWWDVVSLCGWPVIFLVPSGWPWMHAVLPFLIVPLYIAGFKGVLFRNFFRNAWIATIGGMCYSIYLWHFFVIGIAFKLTRHLVLFHDLLLNYVVQIITLGIPIAAVSLLAFMLIERPCMDPQWPRKLIARLTSGRSLPVYRAR